MKHRICGQLYVELKTKIRFKNIHAFREIVIFVLGHFILMRLVVMLYQQQSFIFLLESKT